MSLVASNIFIGIFFLALGILEVLKTIEIKKLPILLWFCNISPFLLAFGFFVGNTQFIKGLINIGIIPQFISLVSLTLVVFFGVDVEVFREIKKEGRISIFISYMIHLFTIYMALFLTISIPATKISLVYSVVVLALLFIFSLLFTPKKLNVNFVHHLKDAGINMSFHKYGWLLGAMALLAIPGYFLQNWITAII
jgi:hypothetical protein